MKKIKQSKKQWAWTEAQKRNHFGGRNRWAQNMPKSFYRQFPLYKEKESKRAIFEIMRGVFPDDVDFGTDRKRLKPWYWWW